MHVNFKHHQVQFDLSTIIIGVLMFSWAAYYYYSTLTGTEEGPDTVLFIKPIFIGILICFPFVVWSATSIKPIEEPARPPAQDKGSRDRGFFDKRRIFFVLALAGYAAAITFLGYLIPSVLFIFLSCYYLGSRNLWVLLLLPVGLSAFLSFVFGSLLKIPISIWPSW